MGDDNNLGKDIGVLLLLLTAVALGAYGYKSPACGQTDDFSLVALASLQLNSSASTDQQLFNTTFWSQTLSSFGSTITQLVPQTVVGFIASGQQWKNWTLQNMQDPPPWINAGITPMLQDKVLNLESNATSTNDATEAAADVQNFAAIVSGYSLAALDFVSFNGLSATQVYFETGSIQLALCSTFPAQIAQLYKSSFDPSVPADTRSQLLGQALAITTFMVVLGGVDGFSSKFGGLLDKVGLSDAWPTIKPYLYDIGDSVSASASATVLSILQTIASRFPQDSVWATGLTADRIDSMVNVLQQDDVPNDAITADIQNLAQASKAQGSEDSVANAADVTSYQDGGGIQVKVRSDNKMVLYDDNTGRTQSITIAFLQKEIPGFDPNGPDFVQIHYHETGITVFHYFPAKTSGQTTWLPVVPQSIAQPKDIITISFDLLTEDEFIQNLPQLTFTNSADVNWVSGQASVTSLTLVGDQLRMEIAQQPSIEGVSNFVIQGKANPLQWVGGDTFVKVTIQNLVNPLQPKTLKILFDGYGGTSLSIQSGTNFNPVSIISSDGIRLRIVSNSGGNAITTTTVYVQDPSILYTLGDMTMGYDYGVQGISKAYQIQSVTLNQQLESTMLDGGSSYDLGRLGAEIAYTVGEQEFGLKGLIMPEISTGGVDLITADKTAVMQARLLNMGNPPPDVLNAVLTQNLIQMTGKLQEDFDNNKDATTGYAVLSYVTVGHGIQTIVLVIPRPSA